MQKILLLMFAAVVLFAISVSSASADIIWGDTEHTHITGINGLQIGDTVYNVTFTATGLTYNEAFDYSTEPTFNDQTSAEAASAAINEELNSILSDPTEVTWVGAGSAIQNEFYLPYVVGTARGDESDVRSVRSINNDDTDFYWDIIHSTNSNHDYNYEFSRADVSTISWATFTAVPVPGAIWLMISGLGLAAIRKRIKS